ncbi:heterokaryon incompatibility protein-domain-containing protein, partial [Chaetomium sp. MPI-CAGE-AT-0009]
MPSHPWLHVQLNPKCVYSSWRRGCTQLPKFPLFKFGRSPSELVKCSLVLNTNKSRGQATMGKPQKTGNYAPFCYSAAQLSAPETQFRLLELLPSTTDHELSCRILVSQVGQPSRQFKALSYTWGKGAMSHSIAVLPGTTQGKRRALAITESLHTALTHLRHARKSVWLWIDQICINQKDHVEKGNQVSLMGSIYAGAEQVVVWLGPAADGSDALMEAWLSVGQAARDFGLESYYTAERWPLLSNILNNEEPTDPKTVGFQTLLRIGGETFAPLIKKEILRHWFAREWFRRAWTIQEFCLCANTVFVCGTKTVQAELVMIAIQILTFSISRLYETIYTPAGIPLPLIDELSEEPTGRLFSCRQRRRKFDRGLPDATGDQLHALMRKLYVDHNTEATLHRDRIFSLLSLAVDAPHLALTPDYTNPYDPATDARILALAARAMLTNPATGTLTILSYAQPLPSTTTPSPLSPLYAHLPTWAPSWRGNLRPSFYHVHSHLTAHLFSACGHAHLQVHPCPLPTAQAAANPNVLGLSGFRVDVISAVAPGAAWTDMSWDAGRFRGFF